MRNLLQCILLSTGTWGMDMQPPFSYPIIYPPSSFLQIGLSKNVISIPITPKSQKLTVKNDWWGWSVGKSHTLERLFVLDLFLDKGCPMYLNIFTTQGCRSTRVFLFSPLADQVDFRWTHIDAMNTENHSGSFVCLFIATRAIFQLYGGCHHCRWQGCKFRPMLSAQGLWAGRDLYRATPTATVGTSVYTVHPKDRHPRPTVGFEPPMQGSSDLCAGCSNHCASFKYMCQI
jgi:hypothetical protein